MLKVLEHTINYSPLGIRFWDPLFNMQVRDSLKVSARSENNKYPVNVAYRTRSDIYTFEHIPGMRDIEYLENGIASATASPSTRPAVVEVFDLGNRFVDAAFKVDLPLPYKGVYLSDTVGSPSADATHGFYLFSSPTRNVPGTVARVHSQLIDADSGQPAKHALIRVESQDGQRWYGLANDSGRIAVYLHYPELTNGFSGSPFVPTNNKPWFERTWDLTVTVYYEPLCLEPLTGTSIPDYKSILQQRHATILETVGEDGTLDSSAIESSEIVVTLEYGKEIILKTAGISELMIKPAISSP